MCVCIIVFSFPSKKDFFGGKPRHVPGIYPCKLDLEKAELAPGDSTDIECVIRAGIGLPRMELRQPKKKDVSLSRSLHDLLFRRISRLLYSLSQLVSPGVFFIFALRFASHLPEQENEI